MAVSLALNARDGGNNTCLLTGSRLAALVPGFDGEHVKYQLLESFVSSITPFSSAVGDLKFLEQQLKLPAIVRILNIIEVDPFFPSFSEQTPYDCVCYAARLAVAADTTGAALFTPADYEDTQPDDPAWAAADPPRIKDKFSADITFGHLLTPSAFPDQFDGRVLTLFMAAFANGRWSNENRSVTEFIREYFTDCSASHSKLKRACRICAKSWPPDSFAISVATPDDVPDALDLNTAFSNAATRDSAFLGRIGTIVINLKLTTLMAVLAAQQDPRDTFNWLRSSTLVPSGSAKDSTSTMLLLEAALSATGINFGNIPPAARVLAISKHLEVAAAQTLFSAHNRGGGAASGGGGGGSNSNSLARLRVDGPFVAALNAACVDPAAVAAWAMVPKNPSALDVLIFAVTSNNLQLWRCLLLPISAVLGLDTPQATLLSRYKDAALRRDGLLHVLGRTDILFDGSRPQGVELDMFRIGKYQALPVTLANSFINNDLDAVTERDLANLMTAVIQAVTCRPCPTKAFITQIAEYGNWCRVIFVPFFRTLGFDAASEEVGLAAFLTDHTQLRLDDADLADRIFWPRLSEILLASKLRHITNLSDPGHTAFTAMYAFGDPARKEMASNVDLINIGRAANRLEHARTGLVYDGSPIQPLLSSPGPHIASASRSTPKPAPVPSANFTSKVTPTHPPTARVLVQGSRHYLFKSDATSYSITLEANTTLNPSPAPCTIVFKRAPLDSYITSCGMDIKKVAMACLLVPSATAAERLPFASKHVPSAFIVSPSGWFGTSTSKAKDFIDINLTSGVMPPYFL